MQGIQDVEILAAWIWYKIMEQLIYSLRARRLTNNNSKHSSKFARDGQSLVNILRSTDGN